MQTAPHTLDQGKLNPVFVEYMMGLPVGWVTDTGLSRAQQLKMLGNGVVPQQAEYALELLLGGKDA
jgi:DNA (cytosine-5)-methyltransferase 1